MAEQTERFKGLRRICQAQEGFLSPSYKVHKIYFDFNEFTDFGFCKRELEIEATDIWFPYYRNDFYATPTSPNPRFPLAVIEFYLNESSMDLMTIDQYHIPQQIKNFPFFKINFTMTAWPDGGGVTPIEFKFYTFTDPRIIQALGKL